MVEKANALSKDWKAGIAMNSVKKIIDEWDPIGLFPGAPDDEYWTEIEEIEQLVSATDDLDELAEGIYAVFVKEFGDDVFKRRKSECKRIAQVIIKNDTGLVPARMQPYFRTTSRKSDKDNERIEGMLVCCNSHEFEIQVGGKVKHNLFSKTHYLTSKDDKITVFARCKKCNKDVTVFDSKSDGYEQMGKKTATLITTKLFACKKCANNNFSVYIEYKYPDVQELKDLSIMERDNAYTWIWIMLVCNKCGKTYRNFVDYETG